MTVDHTSVSLTLEELRALRGGFHRQYPADEAIYEKLCRAERRLEMRSNVDASE